MAVFGIGIDLCEIDRIHKIIEKDDQFIFRNKVFSPEEIAYCENMPKKAQHYAARFAAKESFIKALNNTSIALNKINIEKKETGSPFITVSPQISASLQENQIQNIHLSLTHSKNTAAAVVVLTSK